MSSTNLSDETLKRVQSKVAEFSRRRKAKLSSEIRECDVQLERSLQELSLLEEKFFALDKRFKNPMVVGKERSRLHDSIRDLYYSRSDINSRIQERQKARQRLQDREEQELREEARYQERDFERISAELLALKVREEKLQRAGEIVRQRQADAQRQREWLQYLKREQEAAAALEQERLDQERQLEKRHRAARIQTIVSDKKIDNVLHFTQIENLQSITRRGLISRKQLTDNAIKYLPTDDLRTDNWLNWISLSIGFPNYKMLWAKRRESSKSWAILVFSPEILSTQNCRFYMTNAGRSIFRSVDVDKFSTASSLETMFANPQDRIRQLPPFYPTDPQAEVMVEHGVPIEFLKEVVFERASDERASNIADKVSTRVSTEFFGGRMDHQHWQGRALSYIDHQTSVS